MADNLQVKFKITAPDSLRYWLAVDEAELVLVNGESTLQLQVGVQHVLIWWMIGNPGDTLAIIGNAGEREVVNVKESKVPASSHKGAGYRKFTP